MASYATRHLVHNHQLNGFLGMLRIDWESCLRARILFLVLLDFMFRYAPSTRARAGWPLCWRVLRAMRSVRHNQLHVANPKYAMDRGGRCCCTLLGGSLHIGRVLPYAAWYGNLHTGTIGECLSGSHRPLKIHCLTSTRQKTYAECLTTSDVISIRTSLSRLIFILLSYFCLFIRRNDPMACCVFLGGGSG